MVVAIVIITINTGDFLLFHYAFSWRALSPGSLFIEKSLVLFLTIKETKYTKVKNRTGLVIYVKNQPVNKSQ